MFPPACLGCPFRERATGFVPPDDPLEGVALHRQVFGYGESPGHVEVQRRQGFTGPSGRLLRGALSRGGVEAWGGSATFRARNAMLCRPPGNKFPGVEIAHECLRRHGHMVPEAPCVLYGKNAIESMTDFRFVRGVSPTGIRGSFLPLRGRASQWAVATIHPAYIVRHGESGEGKGQAGLYPFLARDTVKAMREKPELPFELSELLGASRCQHILGQFTADQPPFVSVDIEGRDGKPTILGVAWRAGERAAVFSIEWTPACAPLLEVLFMKSTPIFHNAAYDVQELQEVGVKPPPSWIDTMNMAALFDPSVPKNLQAQVLTHVRGSITWKGLVNHEDPETDLPLQEVYKRLWGRALELLGQDPALLSEAQQWYRLYNALDTIWTYDLAMALRGALEKQGRMIYYREILLPLQAPLIEMGQRGLPCDPAALDRHRRGCERLERMAKGILGAAGARVLQEEVSRLEQAVGDLEERRAKAKSAGEIRLLSEWPEAKELTSLRTKLSRARRNAEEGFNPDSNPQRIKLLYGWYGLPEGRTKGTKGASTRDDVLEFKLSQLQRGTIKPKQGTVEEVVRVIRAMLAAKKWATWRRNFLTPTLEARKM